MEPLNAQEVELVSGGMKWEGNRESINVVDCRLGWVCLNSRNGIAIRSTYDRYRNWVRDAVNDMIERI